MTKSKLVRNLNSQFSLNLNPEDVVKNYDGDWSIDGMDPHEWCEAMTMG